MHLIRNCIILFYLLSGQLLSAETITIAVASNFTAPMNRIVQQFEKSTGHKVRLAFGSSGKIYAQIINGAPFDAFFSADQAKIIGLEKAGYTVPGSRFTYARGALALWSSKAVAPSIKQLREGRFNKLAIANSRFAPYGVAAEQVLSNLGLISLTKNKWVRGENIAQTFQFVTTGNADLGMVALSQIMREGKIITGAAWIVPDQLYEPIRQEAALLLKGKDSQASIALLQFMHSKEVREIMFSYGYKNEHS